MVTPLPLRSPRHQPGASVVTGELVEAFRSALRQVLRRCRRAEREIQVPGESGTWTFRGWFAMECLQEALGWPAPTMVFGDQFDLLLLGARRLPVVFIETKRPEKPSTPQEYTQFEDRLRWFPTLTAAYYTNGVAWHRVDLSQPAGRLQRIESRLALADLFAAPASEVVSFLAPLLPTQPIPQRRWRPRGPQSRRVLHLKKPG